MIQTLKFKISLNKLAAAMPKDAQTKNCVKHVHQQFRWCSSDRLASQIVVSALSSLYMKTNIPQSQMVDENHKPRSSEPLKMQPKQRTIYR